MNPSFGIDFGTTNTRVAYFDGRTVQVIGFDTSRGTLFQLPTAVAHEHGLPVAFGVDAENPVRGATYGGLKWSLQSPEFVEVEGGTRDPIDIAADFLRHLRSLVAVRLPAVPLDRAAVTIPVHYPAAARGRLEEAFHRAGIAVTHFFYEPVAALYAGLAGEPASGVMGVFDWGGGSLDIATVRVRDGIAMTLELDGWHRGGTDFDRQLAEQAVNAFLADHATGLTTRRILDTTTYGRRLIGRARNVKESLRDSPTEALVDADFLRVAPLNHRVSQADLAEMIRPDVTGAVARLDHAIEASGVTRNTLARLFLSGGTCQLRDVQSPLAQQYTGRLVDRLRLPDHLVGPLRGGLDDLGNATAIGAALLAANATRPVFAATVGVRLAGGRGGDGFYPLFRAGDPVPFGKTRREGFFVSDASGGVARLLLCEQHDAALEPVGRAIRLIPVPVERDELWIDAEFTFERHLTLRVKAIGRRHVNPDPTAAPQPATVQEIPSLKLGFPLPA